MKTVLTFAAVSFFSLTTMAADRYPSVTIKSKSRFEIVVDGKHFYGDNTIHLNRISRGMHNIRVFERGRGLFGMRMRLVSSKNFFVRNNDIKITVDRSGFVDIDERGNGNGRGWGNGRDRDWDRDDRGYDRDGRH